MRRVLVFPLASAAFAVLLMIVSVPAVNAGSNGHHSHSLRFGPTPRSYDGSESPFAYSNCLPWDPKLRTWVWVCGPPYPPGIPVIHS
jgi:hypothetical protein